MRRLLLSFLFLATTRLMAGPVVFSEIMYHPLDDTDSTDGDEYEFIELWNRSAHSVSLAGASFTDGIAYTFAPDATMAAGSRLVLARNPQAFASRYPAAVAQLAPGAYTGKLANDGERVTLLSPDGAPLFSVEYNDKGAWPDRPDGHGASLILALPEGTPDDPASWCGSDALNGNPGGPDACASSEVVINEVLTHTDPPLEDAIELFNRSAAAVDVSGWYLSDSARERKKFRIPANTVLPAGGYAVFYQYQFNSNANGNVPFVLSSANGDDVYLTAADNAGNLTRFVDWVSFEAAENGVSFGRFPNGTGRLTPLAALSFGAAVTASDPPWKLTLFRAGTGAANAPARVGPIVISEILYHPPTEAAEDEYIELLNTSTTDAPLFHADQPGNSWRLSGAVEYEFPPSLTLRAGERVLVVAADDPARFRSAHAVDPAVRIFGPWSGRLNDAGDSVRLYKPDTAEPDGFVPYVPVERVDYEDRAPWPEAADGNGASLERLAPLAYANDPANWFAGAPGGSPGKAPPLGLANPTVTATNPAPGESVTVTVTVPPSAALPTQALVRVTQEGNAAILDIPLRDNGAAPDVTAGDRVYTARIQTPATGAWLYYSFLAWASDGAQAQLPPMGTQYVPAPALTASLCGDGLLTTVTPSPSWTLVEATGTVTHPTCFFLHLNGAGEALVDDVSLVDLDTGAEHIRNGGFTAALQGTWLLNGNHAGSERDTTQEPAAASNAVLRLTATGPGLEALDSVSQYLSPSLTIGHSARLRFRVRQAARPESPWFSLKVGAPPPDVILNEIHYHPAGNDESLEFVELHNPSPSEVDLSGWELEGVQFRLPAGCRIAAGGYRVCCVSVARMQEVYGLTDALGNWNGRLQNDGETLRLVNTFGRTVDRVTYGERDPWPVAADGLGAALERRDALADGGTAANWSASLAPTNWQTLAWTGVVAQAGATLSLFLDFEGRCWIDAVSVRRQSDNTELTANSGFDNGMTGWTALGNHAPSRVDPAAGIGGGPALALAGTFNRWVLIGRATPVLELYGDAVSNCVRSAALGNAAQETCIVSIRFRSEGIGGNLCVALGSRTCQAALGVQGTPGRANTAPAAGLPPLVTEARPDQSLCPTSLPNVVRAKISGAAAEVLTAYRLVTATTYRYTDSAYASVTMRDDGAAPDSVAGDGEYAAFLPAVAANKTLVRYHVIARDAAGRTFRLPREGDPSGDYGYFVQNQETRLPLPEWNVFMDSATMIYPAAVRACAVSPEGQVFTDLRIRHRGRENPDNPEMTGAALRMNRGQELNAWFAQNQEGINFRYQGNTADTLFRRVVNEYLAYDLQRTVGLAAPRVRHVCLWVNAAPTVTLELEAPQEEFLADNGIPSGDYVSRSGYSGRRLVAGDASLDNFYSVWTALNTAAGPDRAELVRRNLCMESINPALGLLAITANGDQHFNWNMFQHRSARDGRWRQYPWDVDLSFEPLTPEGIDLAHLHPYYNTPLHPNIWVATNSYPVTKTLFFPEQGPGSAETLAFRYRQQRTVWRFCDTLLTPEYIDPRADAILETLRPAYVAVAPEGLPILTNLVAEVKNFVRLRRAYLQDGNWSDKMPAVWAEPYDPSTVVINEILYAPAGRGEYVELYNTGRQTIDLGAWRLQCGDETYSVPLGTLLAPGAYLVFTDRQTALTNAFETLNDPAMLIQRYTSSPLWDWPIDSTGAVEYATRVVEIPALALSDRGATVTLFDLTGRTVDTVAYATNAPWPQIAGASIELIHPLADNSAGAAWRAAGTHGGTPGQRNAAVTDWDQDGMPDAWELQIVTASGGAIPDIEHVRPEDDFDGDALSNVEEYRHNVNPLKRDTDNDGAPDGAEVAAGVDPADFRSYPAGTPITRVLVQSTAGNSGFWQLGADLAPLGYNEFLGAVSGWQARDLAGDWFLLQAGDGGMAALGELGPDGKPRASGWRVLLAAFPGLVFRSLENFQALVQLGDGGAAYLLEFRADWTPRQARLLTQAIPGVITRSLDNRRILVQMGATGGRGFLAEMSPTWSVQRLVALKTQVPAGAVLRSLCGNRILLLNADASAALWTVDADGTVLDTTPILEKKPGWKAIAVDVK